MQKSLSSFKTLGRFARYMVVGALALGVVGASTVESQAQVKQLRVRGSLQHVHGANIAWITKGNSNYGHDLGPNNVTGYGNSYSGADMDRYFADLKNMRTNVARLWLFEELEGLNFTSGGHVAGINSTFLNNLNDTITRANAKGIALELVLFNHDVGNQFGRVPKSGGSGIKNFITDLSARKSLMDRVVRPLAQAQRGKNGVFGYDIMNESNYATGGNPNNPVSANWSQLHNFMKYASDVIHEGDPSAQVTCSTDSEDSLKSGVFYDRYGGCGFNYYEFHRYSDTPSLWEAGSSGPYPHINRPIVLGEYGARTKNNETIQTRVTDEFINAEQFNGWAGSMAWSYNGDAAPGEYGIVNSVGNWKGAAWKIQWWGQNKFGL